MRLAINNAGTIISASPKMLNRHGLVAGATGTGKTVTVKYIIEQLSRAGVPCFIGDIKGDLTGFISEGVLSDGFVNRCHKIGCDVPSVRSFTTNLYDIFNEYGRGITTTINNFGHDLLANILELNNTQTGVLGVVFTVCKDDGLPLDTIEDLRQALIYCYENNNEIGMQYGSVSKASLGAIQRSLLSLENDGGNNFFTNNVSFNYNELIVQDDDGNGVISLLHCVELIKSPKLYASFLIWLLNEIYDNLPEAGDNDKPIFCMFFDEAHLIFDGASKNLIKKVDQIVRLIRSKGVGIYFCSQSPADIPEPILNQLGLRVQHALRAFTPKALRAVRTTALTMRPNPSIDAIEALQQLNIGEALISVLDGSGMPTITERAFILPPASLMGVANESDYTPILKSALKYNEKNIVKNTMISIENNNNNNFSGSTFIKNISSKIFNFGVLRGALKITVWFYIIGFVVLYFPPALIFIATWFLKRR